MASQIESAPTEMCEVQEPVLGETVEEWRPIPGYEALYEVSNLGRVRTVSRILPIHNKHVAYPKVSLAAKYYKGGIQRHQFELHTLVAAAFLGPRPPKHDVDHLNGDKQDPRACNLEYVTRRENIQRAWRKGLLKGPPRYQGEAHPSSKITDAERRELIRLWKAGAKRLHLAIKYGLKISGVSYILQPCNRKRFEEG